MAACEDQSVAAVGAQLCTVTRGAYVARLLVSMHMRERATVMMGYGLRVDRHDERERGGGKTSEADVDYSGMCAARDGDARGQLGNYAGLQ